MFSGHLTLFVFYIGSMRACPVTSLTILGDPGVVVERILNKNHKVLIGANKYEAIHLSSKYSIIHCFTLTCEIKIVWRVSGNTSAS